MPEKLTALVVEDDPAARAAMLEILDAEGFQGVGVGDLAAARERIEGDDPYAIVLVDVDLPDGSGLDVLKDDRRLANTDVVVITERRRHAPYGLQGGAPGRRGRNIGPHGIEWPAKHSVRVVAGDELVIETPGGGGWGPPDEPA